MFLRYLTRKKIVIYARLFSATTLLFGGLTLAAAALATGGISTNPLKICVEPDNLPLSQKSSHSGYEVEVAELIGGALGRMPEFKWIPQRDRSYFRQTLGTGQCDVIMGVPSQMQNLLTTKPWYRAGFSFVSREDRDLRVTTFDSPLLKNFRIGVPATGLGETPPALALVHRGLAKNLLPYSIYEPKKMIDDVESKKIDLAVLWDPFAGWLTSKKKTNFRIQPAPEVDGTSPLTFEISIGLRKGNESLKQQLDPLLIEHRDEILKILKKWHVPLRKF